MNSFRLKSYLTFLGRNKGYTAINLFGFSVALMFVILLGIYSLRENSVDRFHAKKDRIFALTSPSEGMMMNHWGGLIASELSARYPEIEAATRLYKESQAVDTPQGKIGAEVLTADSTFFNIFSFTLLQGLPEEQLRTKNEVTLTRSFAMKLFGRVDVVGEGITMAGEPYVISGVAEDFENSHIPNPDIVARMEALRGGYGIDHNQSANFPTYVMLHEGADLSPRLGEMADHLKSYYWIFENGLSDEVRLEPLTESYFGSAMYNGHILRGNSRTLLRVLMAVALIVLLFAVINYVNLSVAQSGFRAREAATRRLLGGTRGGLIGGFLVESLFFLSTAFAVALFFAALVEAPFNQLMQSEISVASLFSGYAWTTMIAFVVILGLISGIFPAIVVSRYQPIEVVRGELTRKTRMIYSKLLIGLQFCLTIVLIGCTLIVGRQVHYMRTTPLGFDKEQLIFLENVTPRDQLPGLREHLLRVPGVEVVSFTAGSPFDGGNNMTVTYDDGQVISFQQFIVDTFFMDMMKLEVLSRTGFAGDSAMWINQQAVRELDDKLTGDHFQMYKREVVAGVLKDFPIGSLQQAIPPVVIRVKRSLQTWNILVKINSSDPAATFEAVQAAYTDYNGGEPFEAEFADARIDKWYEQWRRVGAMIGAFCLIAILISAMGLLAMATYFMRQRQREIAVRKVFGSTNDEVLGRLIFGYLRIVAVAFVVAVPVIWMFARGWLQLFAHRISPGWLVFVLCGLIAGAIALAAVYWQSRRATNANPVETLHKG